MTVTTEATSGPVSPLTLLEEQQLTLATPRRRAGIVARSLFVTMDLIYGRRRTLRKFLVLELDERHHRDESLADLERLAEQRARRR